MNCANDVEITLWKPVCLSRPVGYNTRLAIPYRIHAMPKLKSHKGLLKRVRVTAKGKVKWRKSNNSHLRSVKTGNKIRQLRKPGYAKAGDIRRLERILHMRLTPVD